MLRGRMQPTHTGGLQLLSKGREVQPAVGLAWATCVNHRLFLSRDPQPFAVAHPDGAHAVEQVRRTFMAPGLQLSGLGPSPGRARTGCTPRSRALENLKL